MYVNFISRFLFALIFIPLVSYSNDSTASLNELLSTGTLTISEVLSDTSLMYLHPQTTFRNIIKQNARAEKIKIVSDTEPGTLITVKARVKDNNGNSLSGLLVYVYQTSDKGWYSDSMPHFLEYEGDMRHARLFGYFYTDSSGKFEYETIKPNGYPDSDLPAHIHIAFWKDEKALNGAPGELLFDDDPRLTPGKRKSALESGFLISKNSGTDEKPVFYYDIVIPAK